MKIQTTTEDLVSAIIDRLEQDIGAVEANTTDWMIAAVACALVGGAKA